MTAKLRITSSWDDGHPLDMRVADLLAKHGVRGTFYVPRRSEHESMAAAQIRDLGRSFELGAHTLTHLYLKSAPDTEARQEIAGSKFWLEQLTGAPCRLFCPPRGGYADRHVAMIRKAGYIGLRSVEFCSLDPPRLRAGVMVMPTTLQAYPHRFSSYSRNMVKRAAIRNFSRFVSFGRATDWPALAQSFLRHAERNGGVFHLWGHSWELQEAGQWSRLDDVLRLMGDCARNGMPSFTNGEICEQSAPQRESRAARSTTALSSRNPDSGYSGGATQ